MTKTYDLLISGGGPVGMGLAIDLAQRGHSVAVVEKYPQPQPIPKGQNLTQRTMEHMIAWGVEPAIRAAAPIPPEMGTGGMTAYGQLLDRPHHDWLVRSAVRSYYYTANERLPQYATEAVLRARAAQLDGIDLFYGYTTEGITQTDEGVTLTARARDGCAPLTLRGRYLAGCDGARSTTRELAGISETRRDHDRMMVLLVFRAPELHDMLTRFPGKCYFNVLNKDLQGYWLFFGRVDTNSTFFFHAPVPYGTTAENYDFHGMVQKAVGAEFPVEFQHIGFWDLRIAIADSYRQGRVFLAGDAAHSHPPYGGYGINTGFEDVRNLSWKLAMVLDGQAPEALLDSYDAERRPVFASTAGDFIEASIRNDRDFLNSFADDATPAEVEAGLGARRADADVEVDRFEPNYEGSGVVDGPSGGICTALGHHIWQARPGHHLPPRRAAEGWSVEEKFGPCFTLFAIGVPEAEVTRARTALAGQPLRVVPAGPGGEMAHYGARWVLVRPDNFVAWCGDDLPERPLSVLDMALAR
ncbi:MAG: FAD-dependent monooxygenase [Qingshengfaniella sp.]